MQYNFELKETKLLVLTGKDVKTELSQFVSSTVADIKYLPLKFLFERNPFLQNRVW